MMMTLTLAFAVSIQSAAEMRSQLAARGLPAELAQVVATVSADARARGLPVEPLLDKAIEGFSKRVTAPRIEAAVRDLAARLGTSRDALVQAGVASPDGPTIAASADALARNISTADVVTIIRAAPRDAAPAGLSVAAALTANGLSREHAVRLVVESYRAGRSVAQVLDLPAAAATLMGQGMNAADAGRRLLEGIGAGVNVQGSGRTGTVVRPPAVPPIP